MYVPPAAILEKLVAMPRGKGSVTMPREAFLLLLRAAFEGTFDARWYRAAYPDVAEAAHNGEVASELDHFIEAGFWEGRLPCSFVVNEVWYKGNYADVRLAIEAGEVASCHMHFNKAGYFEGRVPDAAANLMAVRWNDALAEWTQPDEEFA